MGKLTKKKMKRIAAEIRANPALARARIQQLVDEVGYTDDVAAEEAFMSFLAAFADDWVKDLHLLSEKEGHMPRLLVYAPSSDTPEQPWRRELVTGGAFWPEGPVTLASLDECLARHIQHVAPEKGIAVWMMATDSAFNPKSPGSLAYVQYATGTRMVVLFQRSSWIRHPLDEYLTTWLTALLAGMNQMQLTAAQEQARALPATPAQEAPEDIPLATSSEESSESELPHSHLGEFGDGLLATLTGVLEVLRETEARHRKELAEAVAEATAKANTAHAEELARRQRNATTERERAERITDGLRARVTRLEHELRALRQQAKAQPVKGGPAVVAADPLGAALDRMFA